ncbi:MAG: shikimate dehydrogenase [Fibromonadaceae bacterium]|jgi:shikimate dehydrogenase|nr:shikimate dehydrogenase [Fibromonadaceae bacterium]
MIDGKTGILGVFGCPIEHTKSPAIHNALLKDCGINATYLALPAEKHNFAGAIAGFRAMGFAGANVTIPFKEQVIPLLDYVSPVSKATNSVNTLYWEQGKLCGTSTDGLGALRALETAGINIKGKNIALLGSGGAAKALAYAFLEDARAASLKIFTIEPENWNLQLKNLSLHNFDEVRKYRDEIDLLCNATPLGMHPNENQSPVAQSVLTNAMAVFDIVYNPLETKLLKEAKEVGCKTLGGIGMLIYQGLESFKLWFPNSNPSPKIVFEVLGV